MHSKAIWVDADACPKVIKEILLRASKRLQILTTFVANRPLYLPVSDVVKMVQVEAVFDVADHYIATHCKAGDLVITSDIPLAAEVIEKEGHIIGFRGERLTKNNIGRRLSTRNLMDELRSSGVQTRGPDALTQADRHKFASELEKYCVQEVG